MALCGNEESHLAIREKVGAHLAKPDVSRRVQELLSVDVADHIRNNSCHVPGVWASSVEYCAAASLIETDIIFFDSVLPTSNSRKTGWFLYPSDLTGESRTRAAIYLKVSNGSHCDVIVSVQ